MRIFWKGAIPGGILGWAILLALSPLAIFTQAIERIIRGLFIGDFETCTHCEEIVFVKRGE